MFIKVDDIRAFASALAIKEFREEFGDEAEVTRKNLLRLGKYVSALVYQHPGFLKHRDAYEAAIRGLHKEFEDTPHVSPDEAVRIVHDACANALADILGLPDESNWAAPGKGNAMTRKEQEKFVKELVGTVLNRVTFEIRDGLVPEDWDGIELRQLLSDHFRSPCRMTGKRLKMYQRTCVLKDL